LQAPKQGVFFPQFCDICHSFKVLKINTKQSEDI